MLSPPSESEMAAFNDDDTSKAPVRPLTGLNEDHSEDFGRNGVDRAGREHGRISRPRIQLPDGGTLGGASEEEKRSHSGLSSSPGGSNDKHSRFNVKLPATMQWIPKNSTWSRWKPVIRSALAAWISALLFAIPKTENIMGQASFLIIIASFLSPPNDPFIAVLERELFILAFVAAGWAWSCLALKLGSLARSEILPTASLPSIITGQYVEAAPTVIHGVFIFLGIAVLLFVKARQGPGPFLFGTIFGSICIDISLTTGSLFPYPYYTIGEVIILPLAFHSAIALVLSILVFPSSMSALFTVRLQGVLAPLHTTIRLHRDYLQACVTSADFSPSELVAAIDAAEGALAPLAAAARLLKMDIIFGRFAPTDYTTVHQLIRRIAVRANGMGMYYSLIDPTREKFPVTPVPSKPATPIGVTPTPSRPHSPDRHSHASHHDNLEHTPDHASHLTGRHKSTAARSRHHHHARSSSPFHIHHRHPHHRSQSHHHNLLHSSLLHLALSRTPRSEFAVGVFESQRYLNLEVAHLSHPESNRFTDQATGLLNASCAQLLEACGSGLEGVQSWLDHVRDHRFDFWVSRSEKERIRKEGVQNYERIRDELSRVLDEFRKDKRNIVLDPYRPALSADYDDASIDKEVPPHRYLFHCYVYQYHLMQFSILLVALFDEIIKLEQHRKRNRLWVPSMPLKQLLSWSNWDATENLGKDDDENPEIIPGMEPSWMSDLGKAARRDPDALPPRNALEMIMNMIYRIFTNLGGGNVLFAVKAGALTVLLSLPSFFKSTASYAYKNKFVWAVFMGQLTLARFRGDTTFGLVARIGSTFCGGIVGMVMWYVSAGSGHGNPYGLLAVFAVCFPFFFFARLYWPGPPMVNMIFFVTTALVVGYSYQDTHLYIPSSPGWGFDVSWRRFLLVTIGVTAACIFSFFPPNTTIRSYQRRTLATTSAEIGSIYCSIVSFANIRRQEDVQQIVQSLVAIRSKLSRSIVLRTNVVYEFSLRGQWPAERYQKIVEIQLEVAYLLSHLMSVVEHLEPAWSHAFLRRTRLLDSDFQGDVLAVISLISSSLRTGSPLPQITPCPLLDRFMLRHHGLNVIHQESEDDYGLPRTLTLETLENEQYLIFCVGVSTVFGIVTRLDHLMVAVKELVGEQYHIQGVGLGHHRKPAGVEMSSPTISMRPMQDV